MRDIAAVDDRHVVLVCVGRSFANSVCDRSFCSGYFLAGLYKRSQECPEAGEEEMIVVLAGISFREHNFDGRQ